MINVFSLALALVLLELLDDLHRLGPKRVLKGSVVGKVLLQPVLLVPAALVVASTVL